MSDEEANKYVKKEFNKNMAIYTGVLAASAISGGIAGYTMVSSPLLGITILGSSMTGLFKGCGELERNGKLIYETTPSTYRRALKNTITLNNNTIKKCEEQIKLKTK